MLEGFYIRFPVNSSHCCYLVVLQDTTIYMERVNPSFDNSWSFIVFTFPTHCLNEAQCCDMLCCSLFLFPQNTVPWRVFRFWMCGIGVIFHLFGETFSKIKRKWFEWCIELILWDTFFLHSVGCWNRRDWFHPLLTWFQSAVCTRLHKHFLTGEVIY